MDTASANMLLHTATRRLLPHSPTARLDAELLLAHVLGWSRTRLLAEAHATPTPAQAAAFAALVERRAVLEPIAYLIGEREFYGLAMHTDARVLVPRPETELLVEVGLAAIRQRLARRAGAACPAVPITVVDVGTGSGAISVALAVHTPLAAPVQFYATDIAADALAVAAANCARHGVAERVELRQGDLLDALPAAVRGQLDILLSNPPYTILAEVEPNVFAHEPHLALDGGADGLAVYRCLLAQVPEWLAPDGDLALEIGAWQADAVCALVHAALPQHRITIHHDLAGHARVVAATPAT